MVIPSNLSSLALVGSEILIKLWTEWTYFCTWVLEGEPWGSFPWTLNSVQFPSRHGMIIDEHTWLTPPTPPQSLRGVNALNKDDQSWMNQGVGLGCNKLANLTTTIVRKVAMNIAFLPGWGDLPSLSPSLWDWSGPWMRHVNFKSSNKYLQIFQQLKVPADIYKSYNNITVPTEIYKSSDNKNCTNRNLQGDFFN